MKTGADLLFEGGVSELVGQRVAFLGNQTAVTSNCVPVYEWLKNNCKLERILGPEHGYWGLVQDMVAVEDSIDPVTGVPISSLYGSSEDTLVPDLSVLDGIDVVVYDIADIGSRYYTYVWSMAFAMKVASKTGKKFVVLDRPNPLGRVCEGGLIDEGYHSFVGAYSVSNRHGMTAAEIAMMVMDVDKLDLDLTCIKVEGWNSNDLCDFPCRIAPSPNMPTRDTALVYPGMCLVEGTEVSEGRGTTRPFEWIGAPYIQAEKLAGGLNELQLPGVFFRPTYFQPSFQKHKGVDCGGVQIHVTDSCRFKPYLTGVSLLAIVRNLYPNDFAWRHAPYEFVDKVPAIDLLTGNDLIRLAIERGETTGLEQYWAAGQQKFETQRESWLLY